ncbi:MAG: hypothetical protein ACYCSF_09880 [Acidimicrobiales bacterium]
MTENGGTERLRCTSMSSHITASAAVLLTERPACRKPLAVRSNARHEGLNRRVRLIVNRAYGFHSANAALGLIMLTLGPIEHVLPQERRRGSDP